MCALVLATSFRWPESYYLDVTLVISVKIQCLNCRNGETVWEKWNDSKLNDQAPHALK